MLEKPVVITEYATAKSQLKDGVDGIIVPLDNDLCAQGIDNLLKHPEIMDSLTKNCKNNDYSNSKEIKKLYKIINQ